MSCRIPLTFVFVFVCALSWPLSAVAQSESSPGVPLRKLPTGVILVKGAIPSSSDSSTPLPEAGAVKRDVYRNDYFGLTYALPDDWIEKYQGPPPSDSGAYVLALLRPGPAYKGASKATLLITAQDLFFTPLPTANAKETIAYSQQRLQSDYNLERSPEQVMVAGHVFSRFDYGSPIARLHWRVLATEIRCHAVRFVFTSPDPALLDTLIKNMDGMKLPVEADPVFGTGGGDAPLCIPHYAEGENVTYKVEPAVTERKFNSMPVRIIIDKAGKVQNVHVISAFAEQGRIITEALTQWRFRPYVRDGQPVEVETGILFGAASRTGAASTRAVTNNGN